MEDDSSGSYDKWSPQLLNTSLIFSISSMIGAVFLMLLFNNNKVLTSSPLFALLLMYSVSYLLNPFITLLIYIVIIIIIILIILIIFLSCWARFLVLD